MGLVMGLSHRPVTAGFGWGMVEYLAEVQVGQAYQESRENQADQVIHADRVAHCRRNGRQDRLCPTSREHPPPGVAWTLLQLGPKDIKD